MKEPGAGVAKIAPELRGLVQRMSPANLLWSAPRIHGELSMLEIKVSEATVSEYMVRHSEPPSQSWRTFLSHHAGKLLSLDLSTVPTVTF